MWYLHCINVDIIFSSDVGGGQECCYDTEGDILSVQNSTGGGFSHRSHHLGVPPYSHPWKVSYLSHFYHDLVNWEHCCLYSGETHCFDGRPCCDLYREVRPSQTCENYVPPNPGKIYHFTICLLSNKANDWSRGVTGIFFWGGKVIALM